MGEIRDPSLEYPWEPLLDSKSTDARIDANIQKNDQPSETEVAAPTVRGYVKDIVLRSVQQSVQQIVTRLTLKLLGKLLVVVLSIITFWCIGHRTSAVDVKPNFSALADIHGTGFELLADQTLEASALSTRMMDAEMATRDLALAVSGSNLLNRERLTHELVIFSLAYRSVAENLQKFASNFTYALTQQITTLEYAYRNIKQVPGPNWLHALIYDGHPMMTAVLGREYKTALRVCAEGLGALVHEANELKLELNRLKDESLNIQFMIGKENMTLEESISSLSGLWIALGQHNHELVEYAKHQALLNDVDSYLKYAANIMQGVLGTLNGLMFDTEGLRLANAAVNLQAMDPVDRQLAGIVGMLEHLGRSRIRERKGAREVTHTSLER
ncbi:hypothetical protein BDP27DRAFT_1309993 [Rhodocollybia butyracea]|uniref:Uncharacterized protein n=1 Tax=Rhodocollybia butyracea TaxID=206335 RepID=A0A9P5UGR1_9AGAR|nr:hypothetical protein BDP27DRAFT_1309993 [Rhodocollybia butyracea]